MPVSIANDSVTRPTVAEFMNELTEVEERVSSPSQSSNNRRERAGPKGITASTATQELDELMGQLSDFKMPQQKVIHSHVEGENTYSVHVYNYQAFIVYSSDC